MNTFNEVKTESETICRNPPHTCTHAHTYTHIHKYTHKCPGVAVLLLVYWASPTSRGQRAASCQFDWLRAWRETASARLNTVCSYEKQLNNNNNNNNNNDDGDDNSVRIEIIKIKSNKERSHENNQNLTFLLEFQHLVSFTCYLCIPKKI